MSLTNIEIKALEAVSRIPSLIKEQNALLKSLIDTVERGLSNNNYDRPDERDCGGCSPLDQEQGYGDSGD